MIKRIYLILERGEWIITMSLWLCASILILVYPTSNVFWYLGALDALIISICIVAVPILRFVKYKEGEVVKHKNINISAIVPIISLALLLFIIGFINFDSLSALPIYSASSSHYVMIAWVTFKIFIEVLLIIVTIKAVKSFFRIIIFEL